MHIIIDITASGTDGSDPSKLQTLWELDGKRFLVSNSLTREDQLKNIYQQAGYDTSDISVQRMIDYREAFGTDAFMEAVVEQLIAICDNQKIPFVESFATIVGLRDAVKEKHPKTNK